MENYKQEREIAKLEVIARYKELRATFKSLNNAAPVKHEDRVNLEIDWRWHEAAGYRRATAHVQGRARGLLWCAIHLFDVKMSDIPAHGGIK